MGPPHEGSIRWPIAPWANALPLSYVPLLQWLNANTIYITYCEILINQFITQYICECHGEWFFFLAHLMTNKMQQIIEFKSFVMHNRFIWLNFLIQSYLVCPMNYFLFQPVLHKWCKIDWYVLNPCHHCMSYSFWLAARDLLYVLSHREDSTYHGLCYTSYGAQAGVRNSSTGPPWRINLMTHNTWANANANAVTMSWATHLVQIQELLYITVIHDMEEFTD